MDFARAAREGHFVSSASKTVGAAALSLGVVAGVAVKMNMLPLGVHFSLLDARPGAIGFL